jgi:hypothetical protein
MMERENLLLRRDCTEDKRLHGHARGRRVKLWAQVGETGSMRSHGNGRGAVGLGMAPKHARGGIQPVGRLGLWLGVPQAESKQRWAGTTAVGRAQQMVKSFL